MDKLIVPERKLLIAGHHSVSDWDFQFAAPNWTLDTALYVVAPASLRLKYTAGGTPSFSVICKYATVLNLPQGELRTWYRSVQAYEAWCTFRNQAAVGSANELNCYATVMSPTNLALYRMVAGIATARGSWPTTHAVNTWERFRLQWWNGNDLYGVDALCVNLYKEVSGQWVQQGGTLYDTSQQWKTSSINRVGLRGQTDVTYFTNFDETEIWGPA